jgi:hypothetical protein
MDNVLTLDGAHGEGGGQIPRATIRRPSPFSEKSGFPPSLLRCTARGCRRLKMNGLPRTLTNCRRPTSWKNSLGSVCREPLRLSAPCLNDDLERQLRGGFGGWMSREIGGG